MRVSENRAEAERSVSVEVAVHMNARNATERKGSPTVASEYHSEMESAYKDMALLSLIPTNIPFRDGSTHPHPHHTTARTRTPLSTLPQTPTNPPRRNSICAKHTLQSHTRAHPTNETPHPASTRHCQPAETTACSRTRTRSNRRKLRNRNPRHHLPIHPSTHLPARLSPDAHVALSTASRTYVASNRSTRCVPRSKCTYRPRRRTHGRCTASGTTPARPPRARRTPRRRGDPVRVVVTGRRTEECADRQGVLQCPAAAEAAAAVAAACSAFPTAPIVWYSERTWVQRRLPSWGEAESGLPTAVNAAGRLARRRGGAEARR